MQNETINLRRQCAARRLYRRAKGWYSVGRGISLALALAAPIVSAFTPTVAAYMAAAASFWLFVSRLLCTPLGRTAQQRAAEVQDLFDRTVLGLGLPRSGEVADEEIHALTADGNLDNYRNWYPAGPAVSWPMSVLICQRANAVWSRRQHAAYAAVLGTFTCAIFVIGVVISIELEQRLVTYLAFILLPSLPFLLDMAELVKGHLRQKQVRQSMEERISLQMASPHNVSISQLKANQGRLRQARTDGDLVPDWFYRLIAPGYEKDMQFAASVR